MKFKEHTDIGALLSRWTLRYIPRSFLQRFGSWILKALAPLCRGQRLECPLCQTEYRTFLPYGRVDVREDALCPGCLSLERHRMLWLFLRQETTLFEKTHRILHIAPALCFREAFEQQEHLDYVTGDLSSPWADRTLDAHDLPFPDHHFDAVLCNHVLEHVRDDRQCMREYFRTLRPGGWALLQSPVDPSLTATIEAPGDATPREREEQFHQEDHLRYYGPDYADRLRSVGFRVTEHDFLLQLPEATKELCALPRNEYIYWCEKPPED